MRSMADWRVEDGIGILTIHNPPVNAISASVRTALLAAVDRTASKDEVTALVIACGGKTFFAGADISEFGKPLVSPYLTDVVDALCASEKPIIAAIHGSALGGGLEIAMGCHYRVAVPEAGFGLPEVKLGLMPGSRGTQLLPRLVGLERALEMIALGESLGARDAAAAGLIDELVEGDLLTGAIAFALRVVGYPPRRTSDLPVAPVPDEFFAGFAAKHARKFRDFNAPRAIIDAIRAAGRLPFEEGARLERDAFLTLREGPQSAAMRHAFFAEREAAKVRDLEGVSARPINACGVIGAGTMGSGIAIALLSAGLPVTLFEKDADALERGADRIRQTLEGNFRSGRLDREKTDAALARLSSTLDMADLASVDLIVEAAFETMEVKRAVFSALDQIAKPGAILASNTSYLDLDEIARVTGRPQDVVGLHFFSPANVMKLLEIVRGTQTAPDVLAAALSFAKRIGKIPVVARNAHGFIGNRMLAVRRAEAEAMLLEGASPKAIDDALETFGFAMGPFRVSDLAGLDLGWSAASSTGSTIRERLCEAGRCGQKTGAGYYDYDEQRKHRPSNEADAIIAAFARENGSEPRRFDATEILDRLIWPMVDEGARLLSEGIAQRASDIDVVWLHGYGWPVWTGGPMHYALSVGISEVARRLEAVGRKPSEALLSLV